MKTRDRKVYINRHISLSLVRGTEAANGFVLANGGLLLIDSEGGEWHLVESQDSYRVYSLGETGGSGLDS